MLEKRKTSWVPDADIKGFFDHLDHEWIAKFVESRIKDPNAIRLIRRMLKGGILKDFQYEETEEGSGRGAVCSPILANIYMHYVLVWWFKEKIQPILQGYSGIIVYADDFVACFENKQKSIFVRRCLTGKFVHVEQVLDLLQVLSSDARFQKIKEKYIECEEKEEHDRMCLLLDMCEEDGVAKGMTEEGKILVR